MYHLRVVSSSSTVAVFTDRLGEDVQLQDR